MVFPSIVVSVPNEIPNEIPSGVNVMSDFFNDSSTLAPTLLILTSRFATALLISFLTCVLNPSAVLVKRVFSSLSRNSVNIPLLLSFTLPQNSLLKSLIWISRSLISLSTPVRALGCLIGVSNDVASFPFSICK